MFSRKWKLTFAKLLVLLLAMKLLVACSGNLPEAVGDQTRAIGSAAAPSSPVHSPETQEPGHPFQTPTPPRVTIAPAVTETRLPLTSAAPRPLIPNTHTPAAQNPAAVYSSLPFGQYIVYSETKKGKGTHLISVEGQEYGRLSDFVAVPITSDGRIVDEGEDRIYRFEDDTTLRVHDSDCGRSISPDLTRMVTWCDDGNLYLTALDGREWYPLTTISASEEYYAFAYWSPDGKWVAFFNLTHGDRTPHGEQDADDGLMLLDTACLDDPGSCRGAMRGPYRGNIFLQWPAAWSPDSLKIAMPSRRSSGPVQVFHLETKTFTPLAGTECGSIHSLAWSPDRQWLAFSCNVTENDIQYIAVVPSTGGEPVRVLESEASILVWYWITAPFREGMSYRVTEEGANLNLRATPSTEGEVLAKLQAGDEVTVLAGPVRGGGYDWWKVAYPAGEHTGWLVEMPGWYVEKQEPGSE